MKNPSPYIRSQIYSLLNGSVLYENSIVPVGDGSVTSTTPYKILIEAEDYANRRSKANYAWQGSQRLEVIYEGPDNVKKHVDAIRSLVLNILEPSLYTRAIPDNEDWQVTNVVCIPRQIMDDLAADGNYIKRAPIEVQFEIIEK